MNHSVGCRRWNVEDPVKGHAFPVTVMYPTTAPENHTAFGPYTLHVAMDAPVARGRFPLVVISHGSSSSPMVFRTLAQTLAANGCVVCLPQHPFDNALSNELQYTHDNLLMRPRQLSLAIDAISAAPSLRPHVDATQVGVIGHSVGGYTALAAADAQPHTGWLVEFCHRPENAEHPYWTALVRRNQVPSTPVEVQPDPRVKALVLLAPDVSLFMHEGALRPVRVPVMLRVAEHDLWTQETLDIINNGLGDPSTLDAGVVRNAGHYAFISPFPEALKGKVGEASIDPPGFDRTAFQDELASDILAFLDRSGLRAAATRSEALDA